MKFYAIFFLNLKDNKLIFCNFCESESIEELKNAAIDYVRQKQGDQQAEITFQDQKKIEYIKNNDNLKEGLYLLPEKDYINLYEKEKCKLSGYIYDSYYTKITKVGQFFLTSLYIELKQYCKCECQKKLVNYKNIRKTNYPFIEELKKLLENGKHNNFGLRPLHVSKKNI